MTDRKPVTHTHTHRYTHMHRHTHTRLGLECMSCKKKKNLHTL